MQITPFLLNEINHEAEITRRFLAIVPKEHFSWKPHDKSMSLLRLATHIAELPAMVKEIIETDELNLATHKRPSVSIETANDLTALHDASIKAAITSLQQINDDDLLPEWTFSKGDYIIRKSTKYEAVRNAISHTLHHRAQLGVYLRLLDVPIPGSYGPSADEL